MKTVSYPKNKIKVLLLDNVHQKAKEIFEEEGYAVEWLSKSLPEEELMEKIKDVSILGNSSRTTITKKILDAAHHLLVIGRFGIGINNIDVAYAASKGVAVFNAPYSNTRSVVELTMGEIILLYRHVYEKSVKMHQGIWDKTAIDCHEVRGKTLGIIGYGNIGSQLSVLAEMMGMKVCFYDIQERLALGNATACSSLKKLLHAADVISIHVDGREENTNLIGEKEFSLMKDGVIFLNASRGFIVDMKSLVKYIKNGKIQGAAVDVFPKEPKSNDEPFASPLQGLPNVILTPHIGGRSIEAQAHMAEFVPEKIIHYINSGNTMLSVNFPNISLPQQSHAHRLLHVHKNIPGVLAHINNVFAKDNINIEGQYLKTNEYVGYVITDINTKHYGPLIEDLKNIPGTIKLRELY